MAHYAIFGSSFNPPTRGHIDAIEQIIDRYDYILLVPCYEHAFGKKLIAYEHRIKMLQIVCQSWSSSKITISNIEQEIHSENPGPIYTYEVMKTLQEQLGSENKLSFIIGPDNASPQIWEKFYRHQDIEANWSIDVVKQRTNIHSQDIRILLEQNKTSADITQQLNRMLLPAVTEYILQEKLYYN